MLADDDFSVWTTWRIAVHDRPLARVAELLAEA